MQCCVILPICDAVYILRLQGDAYCTNEDTTVSRRCINNCKFPVVFQKGVFFIVDEVQTGCGATGDWWRHEAWNLPQAPDIVTFSKKALTGGFFHTDEMRQTEVRIRFRIARNFVEYHGNVPWVAFQLHVHIFSNIFDEYTSFISHIFGLNYHIFYNCNLCLL